MGWFITASILLAITALAIGFRVKLGKDIQKNEAQLAATQALYDESPRDNYKYERPIRDLQNEVEGDRFGRLITLIVAGVLGLLGVLFLTFSMVFTQGVGEAKVIVNLDGTVATTKLDPGFGVKAPWQNTVDFDIFQQQVLFAGTSDNAPSYSGGEVNGAEVTATVKRGAQGFIDVSVVYSLDPEQVEATYNEYRSQERFTRQIVIPAVLASIRDIPSAYTPVEFRGEKRGEASAQMLDTMNDKLVPFGIEISNVDLQDIRYTDQVEESIKAVEVAQQREETAQADLRATEVSAQAQIVEAEAKAKAEIAKAQGSAEANRLLTESLSPQILQNNYIAALKEGTVYVVPDGSIPMVGAK